MKIKKGDKIKIIAGKDKGKTGKVLQIFTARQRVSVEGLNLSIKHMRPRKQGEKGQRIEFPAPMSLSNLMLVCPRCNQPTRISYTYKQINKNTNPENADKRKINKKKYRVCKKCKQTID